MARRGALGWAALAGGVAAGVAVGWAAERRAVRAHDPVADPEWEALAEPVQGRALEVTSFDGTRLHADVLGPDDAPTIVLAHGYVMAVEFWHYQRRDLAGDYRVVAYDQRGHGRSEPARDRDWSVQALGRDLAAVLDATVPAGRRAVVVGHSMGGMSALAYAEVYPPAEVAERLAGVVLANTAASDTVREAVAGVGLAVLGAAGQHLVERGWGRLGRRASVYDRAYSASSDLSYLITRRMGLSPDASPAHVAFTERLVLGCPTAVVAALGPAVTSVDLREAVQALKVPALVVAGERDRLTPLSHSVGLAEALPDAELVVLEGVGHMTPLEAHGRFTGLVREFAGRVLA